MCAAGIILSIKGILYSPTLYSINGFTIQVDTFALSDNQCLINPNQLTNHAFMSNAHFWNLKIYDRSLGIAYG